MVEDPERKAMRDFFFPKPPEIENSLVTKWIAEGRCPKCGDLGRVHLSAFICSYHGVY
jgi:hypothetical protein